MGSTFSIFDAIHPTGSVQAGSIGLGNYSISRTGNFNVAEVIIFNTKLSDTDRNTVEAYLKSKWIDGGGNPDPVINRPSTLVDTTATSTLSLGSATSDHTLGKFSVAGGATLTIANAKSVTLNGIGASPTVSIAATGSSGTTATISGAATLYPKTDISASGASLSIGPAVVINSAGTRNVSGNVTMASLDLSSATGTISTGSDVFRAIGGGGGGSDNGAPTGVNMGATGGSGGGAANCHGSDTEAVFGTAGQGNAGGAATSNTTTWRGGSGGGGAGGAGVARTGYPGGAGGAGLSYSISGSSVTYAAGGAGGTTDSGAHGANATANTGNGGGGGGSATGFSGNGGKGGSGTVIVSYAGFAAFNLSSTHIAATADSTLDLGASGASHILGNVTVTGTSANTTLTVDNVTSLTIGTLTIGINGANYGKLNLNDKTLALTSLAVTSTSPTVQACCVAVAAAGSFSGLGTEVTEAGGRKWKVEVRNGGTELWLVAAPGGTVVMFK